MAIGVPLEMAKRGTRYGTVKYLARSRGPGQGLVEYFRRRWLATVTSKKVERSVFMRVAGSAHRRGSRTPDVQRTDMLANMSEALKLRPDGFRERGAQVTRLEPIPVWVGRRLRQRIATTQSGSHGGVS